MRIDRHREGDVGERTQGEDGHLMRMRMDLADQEMHAVLRDRRNVRRTLRQRRHVPRTRQRRLRRPREPLTPGAAPRHLTHEGYLETRLLLRADQGKHRAQGHRHVGGADQFEHAQRVLRLVVAPGVAGDHGDAENLHVRGLQQHHHGHLIRAARSRTILIDEHQAFGRQGRRAGRGSPDRRRGHGRDREQGAEQNPDCRSIHDVTLLRCQARSAIAAAAALVRSTRRSRSALTRRPWSMILLPLTKL